jgi:hypothetical protein
VQNRCVDWRCVYARKLLISRAFTAASASASASRASTGNEVGMQWMPSQERHFRWGISVPTSRSRSRLWFLAPLTSLDVLLVRSLWNEREGGGGEVE